MIPRRWLGLIPKCFARSYRVLAIESSCDDSCVAVLDRSQAGVTTLIEHTKSTLNSASSGGIIPTKAHEFHQQELPHLIQDMILKYGSPDLICCTRGPGMMGSLAAGLQLSKGLALGLQVPLIGVHHMLGHILIAKLPSPNSNANHLSTPQYPFLSLLCSGGHTLLVLLKSLTNHEIIIDTADIAVGDSLDKCGRELGLTGNMIGKELETFVANISEETRDKFKTWRTNSSEDNPFGFVARKPFKRPSHERIPEVIQFAFSGFLSSVRALKKSERINFEKNHKDGEISQEFSEEARQFAAYKLQEVMFDHIIDRINIALEKYALSGKFDGVNDLIFSGGVASNKVFREKLNGFNFNLHFPDPALCTDNAVMIGVTGIDIYEELRLETDLSVSPIAKWKLNDLLEVDGWKERRL